MAGGNAFTVTFVNRFLGGAVGAVGVVGPQGELGRIGIGPGDSVPLIMEVHPETPPGLSCWAFAEGSFGRHDAGDNFALPKGQFPQPDITYTLSEDWKDPAVPSFSLAIDPPALPVVSNGMRVVDEARAALYVMIDAQLRHIPDPATENRLFTAWIYSQVPVDSGYPIGPPLDADASLATAPAVAGHIFLLIDGQKRFIHPQAFQTWGFNTATVVTLTDEQLGPIPPGDDIWF